MKNHFKKDLSDLILDSDLNHNQKLLWELFLKISMPEEDEAVFEAANESVENISLLTKHLRDKVWDMKENNKDIWNKLTKGEERYASIL